MIVCQHKKAQSDGRRPTLPSSAACQSLRSSMGSYIHSNQCLPDCCSTERREARWLDKETWALGVAKWSCVGDAAFQSARVFCARTLQTHLLFVCFLRASRPFLCSGYPAHFLLSLQPCIFQHGRFLRRYYNFKFCHLPRFSFFISISIFNFVFKDFFSDVNFMMSTRYLHFHVRFYVSGMRKAKRLTTDWETAAALPALIPFVTRVISWNTF